MFSAMDKTNRIEDTYRNNFNSVHNEYVYYESVEIRYSNLISLNSEITFHSCWTVNYYQ